MYIHVSCLPLQAKYADVPQLLGHSSANLEIVRQAIALSGKHVPMEKFESEEEEHFRLFAGELPEMLQKLRETPLLEQADKQTLRDIYTPGRLGID